MVGLLEDLYALVRRRGDEGSLDSYTVQLLESGVPVIAKKLGEESVEALIEAVRGDKPKLIAESTDLLYHLVVLWRACGIDPSEIEAEVSRRKGKSGLQEKSDRKN